MTIGEIIKEYRTEHGLTMQEFADKCGFSKGYISMLENNMNPRTKKPISPALDKIKIIADVMHVDFDKLIEGADDQLVTVNTSNLPDTITIDVYDCVAAGIPNIFAEENVVDHEDISAEMSATGDYFGLKVKGDSMQPRICDGDTVIVRKQSTADDGQIVIALINGDYGVCKKLTRNKAGIGLISLNPIYEPLYFTKKEIETEPVTILGVVKELRAKF